MEQDLSIDWSQIAAAAAGFMHNFSLAAQFENLNDSNSSALVKRQSSQHTDVDGPSISLKQVAGTVISGWQVANALRNDYKHETARNTVEAASCVTGGCLGGYLGSSIGAGLGRRGILPSVSETIGGAIGAIAGTYLSEAAAGKICDAVEMDIERRNCGSCGRTFNAKLYRGESLKNKCDACMKN